MPVLNFNKDLLNIDSYDYCIVGAGVVGLSMALKLASKQKNKSVIVLESGGLLPGESQAANQATIVGNKAYNLGNSRIRALGGTQWVWGGHSRPLYESDFQQRDWIANSGWPITYADFAKHIESATMDLDIDNTDWKNEHPELKHVKLNDTDLFEHTHFKLSPQIVSNSELATGTFYQSNKKKFNSLNNLTILLNATVINFKTAEKKTQFKSLSIRNIKTKTDNIKAEKFIFAAGALENARLLKYFSQLDHAPQLECKNIIGRYFMEHPHRSTNLVITPEMVNLKYNDYFGRFIGSSLHQARFKLNRKILENKKINDIVLAIRPYLEEKLLKGIFPKEKILSVVVLMEQEPNYSNRIELTNEKDIFGIPKIKLHWNLSEQDWKSLEAAGPLIGRFVGTNKIGRSQITSMNRKSIIRGGHHHMGTTRMGSTPKDSVVDSNCKVFGLDNVYMAGGSIFPTSGAVNPTINMLILAHRLVNYLTLI